MAYIKEVEIKGKNYKLTANRKLMKTIYQICPEALKIDIENSDEEKKALMGVELFANLDILFYEMLKPLQPDISKETSDKILENFEEEYSDVRESLVNFASSSFTQGDQTKKKQLNW